MTVDPEKLAAAQAVLAEHEVEEQEKRRTKYLALQGRFFKFLDSSGYEQELRFVYGHITGVHSLGWWPTGWIFRWTARREMVIDGQYEFQVPDDWTEILADEFWAAAEALKREVVERLTEPVA